MKYLYHRKPNIMKGSILYPLNQLRDIYPDIYSLSISKYQGREYLLDQDIPILNCKWKEVIHLSPLHPNLIFKELNKNNIPTRSENFFYKIPIEKLVEDTTVCFKYEFEDGRVTQDQIKAFNKVTFNNLNDLPQETKSWYHLCSKNKEQPLLYHMAPHILTSSRIDILDCEVISWC